MIKEGTHKVVISYTYLVEDIPNHDLAIKDALIQHDNELGIGIDGEPEIHRVLIFERQSQEGVVGWTQLVKIKEGKPSEYLRM